MSHVRFAPESGHAHRRHRCPLSAINRHSPRGEIVDQNCKNLFSMFAHPLPFF